VYKEITLTCFNIQFFLLKNTLILQTTQ